MLQKIPKFPHHYGWWKEEDRVELSGDKEFDLCYAVIHKGKNVRLGQKQHYKNELFANTNSGMKLFPSRLNEAF